ncbi:unnamed protein product [Trifolium pratense]|uniref:Uncharacterized protein n=1 Tax=Trifolium pratense TaxID=57577 RepID=A0ACB0JFE5_TRIPR|nr:unnamed protein product [Trifolium pratense]
MYKQKSSPLILQLQRDVKKLKYLLRVHSNIVSKNVKQRWRSLFCNRKSLRRFQDDEKINRDNNMILQNRTVIYDYEDDDIDKRAEIFITNFRRQLSLERRVFA